MAIIENPVRRVYEDYSIRCMGEWTEYLKSKNIIIAQVIWEDKNTDSELLVLIFMNKKQTRTLELYFVIPHRKPLYLNNLMPLEEFKQLLQGAGVV